MLRGRFCYPDVTSTNRDIFRDGHVTDVTVTFFVMDVMCDFCDGRVTDM